MDYPALILLNDLERAIARRVDKGVYHRSTSVDVDRVTKTVYVRDYGTYHIEYGFSLADPECLDKAGKKYKEIVDRKLREGRYFIWDGLYK